MANVFFVCDPLNSLGSSSFAESSTLQAMKTAPASRQDTVTGSAESNDQPIVLGKLVEDMGVL